MSIFGKRLRQAETSYELRRSPLTWLVVSGLIMTAAIAFGTAVSIDRFRDVALNNGSQKLESAVLLLARHFDQQLEDFATLHKDVVTDLQSFDFRSEETFKGEAGTLAVHEMLRKKVGGWADIAGFNVFDTDGRLVNSSRTWPVANVDISDREYFKLLAGDPDRQSEMSLVTSRFSARTAIVFARKITGKQGDFLGVVTRAVSPDSIGSYFASAGLGDGASVAMHLSSGVLLARYPSVDDMLGKNFKDGSPDQRAVFNRSKFITRLTSPMDGKDRLLASRALSSEPLVVVATQTTESMLSTWRSQTWFFVGAAAIAIIVICTTLYLVFNHITRQLSAEKRWLRTAVNNMNQGLLLFDSSKRLVVCNARYLEMYGLSDRIIRPGCSLRQLVQHRAETGSLGSDAEAYYLSVVRATGSQHVSIGRTTDGRSIKICNEPIAGGGWLVTHEDVTERLRAEEKISHLAYHDQLTGLPNRAFFGREMERRLSSLSCGVGLTLLFIDVDKFKDVNDSLGHHVGDELLKLIASRLMSCVGPDDIVARLGGDEFAVVTARLCEGEATQLAFSLQEAIRLPCNCFGHQINASSSVGVAIAPQHGSTVEQLLKNADLAMYTAKASGRRSTEIFNGKMEEKATSKHRIEIELRNGLRENRFEIHYQPIVDAADGYVSGFEALLRFTQESGEPLSPALFIPVAEEVGLIIELGDWVLRQSCLAAAAWPDHFSVAVNVSPIQFTSGTFALNVMTALNKACLHPSRLEIEITEAVLIKDDETALSVLQDLKNIGVRIALDDFGTGFSSLSYLRKFPFDRIKIDRSFVANIDPASPSSAIVEAIISMARACDMKTTAEGVETADQRDQLRALGCDQMQGYLFSPALPLNKLAKVLRNRVAA